MLGQVANKDIRFCEKGADRKGADLFQHSNWPLLAVLCRSWLQGVMVKSDAIGGQNECK